MKNDVMTKPFPDNLFEDLNAEPPKEQAEDFTATLMYVLRVIGTARDAKAILMRYQNGKNFDEIGEDFQITKQRAHAMIEGLLEKITGDHVAMLTKGMKRYMDELLQERIENLGTVLTETETQKIKAESYDAGYKKGYDDGMAMKQKNPVNLDDIKDIRIDSLGLSVRSTNAFVRAGIATIGEMLALRDTISNLRGFGALCFKEVAETLAKYGLDARIYFPMTVRKFEVEGKYNA